ncbi:MAG TPA: 4Fe-4S dicluster domain-containing protein [Desulfobacteraceae bacterium]|nr:4Fe-4S dicluster domain-containing protein [Desulfobacteraceae bacterium]HPJ67200.1 4Fe-4S dicluster domain-containing protein [Desulfobacteraceae bacterium]HPQ26861.1 4Fe-4S dicluster domain-containing protein [Desulfobacteraceae bacterium]
MKRIKGICNALAQKSDLYPTYKRLPLPKKVVLPLGSFKKEMIPLVKTGDKVVAGQRIGEDNEGISPPVYASISGEVKEIKPWLGYSGQEILSVVIESDGEKNTSKIGDESKQELDDRDIISLINDAGIKEVDNFFWPLPLRISKPSLVSRIPSYQSFSAEPVEYLIINGMDRQPGVSVRRNALINSEKDILESIPVLQKVSDAKKTLLTVYEGYPVPLDFEQKLKDLGVTIIKCPNKYPIALEPLLIKYVTGREVSQPIGNSRDVGSAVIDVITAVRVIEAVREGMISTETTVQVSALFKDVNVYVRVAEGILLEELIEQLLLSGKDVSKAIIGGSFLGYAQQDLNVPITQEADAIILQNADELSLFSNQSCINCGYCVRSCPMRLMPNELSKNCEYSLFDKAEELDIFYCIECGICSYVCPARRPMVHLIRFGKREILASKEES